MKKYFKPFLFICIALVAIFSCGIIEPVGATECVSNFIYEHADFTPALAGLPLLATMLQNNCTIQATELDALKQKYGKIKIITVVLEAPVYDATGQITEPGEVYYFAVRRPDTGHVRMLMDYAKKGDIDAYVNCFIKNLVVAGDTKSLDDGLVYLGFQTQIEAFLKPYGSFLEKA